MKRIIHINPKTRRHKNSEFPSILYFFQGLTISALSRTTLSRNINLPLELSHVKTTMMPVINRNINIINMNHPGLSISHSHALCGKSRNSRKLIFPREPEPFDPPGPSRSPARKALNPMTNHLWRSKGLNRASFILSQARLKGSM